MAGAGGNFPHLPWPLHSTGQAIIRGRGKTDPRTQANQKNGSAHAEALTTQFTSGLQHHKAQRKARPKDAPTLPAGASFLLQVEPDSELDWLITLFDLEIVAEESEGYVLVAAEDLDLKKVWSTLNKLALRQRGGGQAAKLYGVESESERLKRILSDSLWEQWPIFSKETNE